VLKALRTVDFADLCITSDVVLTGDPMPAEAFRLPDVPGRRRGIRTGRGREMPALLEDPARCRHAMPLRRPSRFHSAETSCGGPGVPMGAACATAAYTLVDGIGARASGDALAYVAWLFVLDGILFSSLALMIWGRGVVPANGRAWQMGALAAGASVAAYAIAVWAMTVAPIALVAALRESSILFAVLIGWLVFGERLRPEKAVAVALIVAGVVVTRV
jgi:uncharacterized membrane protein